MPCGCLEPLAAGALEVGGTGRVAGPTREAEGAGVGGKRPAPLRKVWDPSYNPAHSKSSPYRLGIATQVPVSRAPLRLRSDGSVHATNYRSNRLRRAP